MKSCCSKRRFDKTGVLTVGDIHIYIMGVMLMEVVVVVLEVRSLDTMELPAFIIVAFLATCKQEFNLFAFTSLVLPTRLWCELQYSVSGSVCGEQPECGTGFGVSGPG